jgi:diguanylate cyclase (GGDEF)-like protein
MRRRVSALRSKLLIVVIAAFALFAIAFIVAQMETLRSSSERSRSERDLSTAQLLKLYLELEVPGEWRARGDRLYKGDSELVQQEYLIRRALAEYLRPNTVIRFGTGEPPAADKAAVPRLPSVPSVPGKAEAPGLASPAGREAPAGAGAPLFEKPDLPFMTDEGAGVAVKDPGGRGVGWILVASGDAASDARESLEMTSFMYSAALAAAILVGLLAFLLIKVSKPIDVIAEAREFAERRSELLANMSKIDPLTGLFNRRGLEDAVADAHYRGSTPSHVAFVDIDRFKDVNDRRGHEEGDRVLAAVSGSLARGIRQQDICARWGGEEFALVLYGMSDEGILATAERLRADVAGLEFGPEGERYGTTVTIGVAALEGRTLPKALASADQAMYRGKREGRDRVVAAGPDEG